MEMQEQQSSWMNSLPPKVLFIGGLVGGIMTLCTIGFFILLGMMVSGKSIGSLAKAPVANVAAPTPDAAAPTPAGKPAAVTADDHILGNKNAKVTLIEYSDFQCPFCSRFAPVALQLVNDSQGKVALVYRNFPLESIHPMAFKSAVAAECVASLRGNDVYWKYHTDLFNNQGALSDQMLTNTAVKLGVNKAQFETCINSKKFDAKIKATEAEGESIGVQGTPATFVVAADGSSELIPGALPLEQAKVYVDRALAK